MVLALNIKIQRQRMGISQQQLATAIGCSQMHVINIEKGARNVYAGMLRNICSVLEVSMDSMFQGVPEPTRKVVRGRREIEIVGPSETANECSQFVDYGPPDMGRSLGELGALLYEQYHPWMPNRSIK